VRRIRRKSKIEKKGENMFKQRLGGSSALCSSGHTCPQILEMTDGDFAGVGQDITNEAIPAMPPGPGVGPKERVIRIPRAVLIAARAEIPAA
jgi:hypothetical protein